MATLLIGEVENSGGATAGGGDGAGLEVIAGNCGGQGQFHMRMYIDSAGKDVFPLGIYRHVSVQPGECSRPTDRRDMFVVDQDIAVKIIGSSDDTTICEQGT